MHIMTMRQGASIARLPLISFPALLFIAVSLMLQGCLANGNPEQAAGAAAATPNQSAHKPDNPSLQSNRSPAYQLNFSREIRGGIMTADSVFPELPKYGFNLSTQDGKPIVYYFYSPNCVASKALRPEIDALEAKYHSVLWVEYDITTQNGTKAYDDFAEQYNLSIKGRLVPQALVNGTVITDRFKINSTLGSLLENLSAS
jgi:thiol-disulfide isomerase/thioredoxin